MDLSKYSTKKLHELRRDIDKEIGRKRQQERREALREAKQIAEQYGFALDDLVGGTAKAKGRTSKGAVRFRHPDDNSKTWSGRGRKPVWVKEWEAEGNSVDELRVA